MPLRARNLRQWVVLSQVSARLALQRASELLLVQLLSELPQALPL